MDKKSNCLILGIICIFCSSMFGSCSFTESYDEKDFYYFYIEEEDCFAVVRDNQRIQDRLFVPAYYKNKEVRYTCFDAPFLYGSEWWYLSSLAQETYLPYTHQWGPKTEYDYIFGGNDLVLSHISVNYAKETLNYYINWQIIVERDFLLVAPLYDMFSDELKERQEKGKIQIIEESNTEIKIEYVNEWEETVEVSFKKLNVSYLFNYEGEPNAGYFFARGFEAGGKIENTPYEPMRDGYTFGGWYKEAECINEWDFDEDKLPEAEYDEEGNVKLVETKLYAKWIKK